MNFSVVKQAGLKQFEFGDLIGVSRITAHKYLNAQSQPNSKGSIQRIEKALSLLAQLVAGGKLPMKTTERDKRKNNIEKLKQFLDA